MAAIGKAEPLGNFLDGGGGKFEQTAGMINPPAKHVARGADFHVLPEPTDEAAPAHARPERQPGHRDRLGQGGFNFIEQGV